VLFLTIFQPSTLEHMKLCTQSTQAPTQWLARAQTAQTHLVRIHTVLDSSLDVVRYVVCAGPDDHGRYAVASCFIPHDCNLETETKIPSLFKQKFRHFSRSLHTDQAGGSRLAFYYEEVCPGFDSWSNPRILEISNPQTLAKAEKQRQKKK
jgi:hypothetical protein